jgi:tetratricopeptide (TPR) repeat protein
MNTELYPEDFNTYDSYGECLVKIGRIEEGITAYKKSLELNPNNENAKKVLEEIEK